MESASIVKKRDMLMSGETIDNDNENVQINDQTLW